ncbi:uncharacterized protein LOC136754812 [Amia ocellicauda]|uniref:uncharacterized protein LOC136754812 n=1 Tax=Amia ocellicauda TaxID=2972642 RepID=UPI0034642F17
MDFNSNETTNDKVHLYNKSKMREKDPVNEIRTIRISLMKIFVVCLLTSFITIALGVSVVLLTPTFKPPSEEIGHVEKIQMEESHWEKSEEPSNPAPVDPKYKYLNHMDSSKRFVLEGGVVQWARYLQSPNTYDTREEEAFGNYIHEKNAKMIASTLLIKPDGCRVPHWHFNANEHGYLATGKAWIGVLDSAPFQVTSYNVSVGQVIFLPRGTLHWMKCVGDVDCLFVLFFSTSDELLSRDVDDVFYATPQEIAAQSLKPKGGINFIKSFKQPKENQAVNLPPNLKELVNKASYIQSQNFLVWRYFFDLKASKQFRYPGGVMQWARYLKKSTWSSPNEKVFAKSLHEHEDTVTIATMRIFTNGMRQPHFHGNANEMGYVLSGCGTVGVIDRGVADFDIKKGDVFFFPRGTQHYMKSKCKEDLFLVIGYSTGNELQTMNMNIYFQSTADFILAQLFRKKQSEFQKIPIFKTRQDINLP